MAKKRFDISATLNKNQASKLAEKVPLKKKAKDINDVKEKVEQIHPQKEANPVVEKEKIVAKTTPKPPVQEKIKLVRLTIDTPEGMHKRLKIKSIERGISMRDYILKLIEKELK